MKTCYHCGMNGLVTPATCRGEWFDGEDGPSGEWTYLCEQCAAAGDPHGPGYRDVESLDRPDALADEATVQLRDGVVEDKESDDAEAD